MKQIFKYPVKVSRTQEIEMPKGAEILSLQTQNNTPYIWALVDEDLPKEYRFFEVFGTGYFLPEENRNYIGTFQIDSGAFVGHCFELLKK